MDRWTWGNWPLALKLTLSTTLLIVTAMLTTTLVFVAREQDTFETELQQQAQLLVDALATVTGDALYNQDVVTLKSLADRLRTNEITLANRIYDAGGHLIVDTDQPAARFSTSVDPWGQQLLASGGVVFDSQPDRLVAGEAVRVGNQRLGAVSLALSKAPLVRKIEAVRNQGLLLTVVMGLAELILAFLLSRSLTGRLGQLVGATRRVAEGDLSVQVVIRGRDELGVLAEAFNNMIAALQATVVGLQDAATRVTSASSEIAAAVGQHTLGSRQQAGAISEVTGSIEELNQTAAQIAGAAVTVAAAADHALQSAARGQEAVGNAIAGMGLIRERVTAITERILHLAGQSQRIREITDVMDEIAATTHVLALNAAIESAGAAGTVGERFGVIALEVRQLAQHSVRATQEVRDLIDQVQAATNGAVRATEEGLKETERGVQIAHQSGAANDEIIQLVQGTAEQARSIRIATQQQRMASEQVLQTMQLVGGHVQQAAEISEQMLVAVNQLSDVAQASAAASHRFHLGSADPVDEGPDRQPAGAGPRTAAEVVPGLLGGPPLRR